MSSVGERMSDGSKRPDARSVAAWLCIFHVHTRRDNDMRARVQRWGHSLALRIPKPLAAEVGLKDNSPVELSLCEGKLIITPSAEPAVGLDDLLAKVTKRNHHGEIDTGPARGAEVW
jgi:antitoxin MazE